MRSNDFFYTCVNKIGNSQLNYVLFIYINIGTYAAERTVYTGTFSISLLNNENCKRTCGNQITEKDSEKISIIE